MSRQVHSSHQLGTIKDSHQKGNVANFPYLTFSWQLLYGSLKLQYQRFWDQKTVFHLAIFDKYAILIVYLRYQPEDFSPLGPCSFRFLRRSRTFPDFGLLSPLWGGFPVGGDDARYIGTNDLQPPMPPDHRILRHSLISPIPRCKALFKHSDNSQWFGTLDWLCGGY